MVPSRHQVWAQRLGRYRRSSLTVRAFCQAENVSVPSFYQWKKKLAQAEAPPSPAFVPVELSRQYANDLDLMLPGGATLKLNTQLSDASMRRVIAAVVEVTAQADAS